jgi:hypothetical protein
MIQVQIWRLSFGVLLTDRFYFPNS